MALGKAANVEVFVRQLTLTWGLGQSMSSVFFVFPSNSGQGYTFYPRKLLRFSSLSLIFFKDFCLFFKKPFLLYLGAEGKEKGVLEGSDLEEERSGL